MLNILTIDLEDYFQVHAFSKCIRYGDWGSYECRVERNTHRLLNILGAATPPPVVNTPYACSYSSPNALRLMPFALRLTPHALRLG